MTDAIDIYSGNNNGNDLNVEQAKAEGIKLIIPKATEGRYFYDPQFSKTWRNTKSAGLRRGAYHFFRSNDDATAQADYFYNRAASVDVPSGNDILALDYESFLGQWDLPPGDPAINAALAFMERLEQLSGLNPLCLYLYCNWDFWVNYLHMDGRLRKYGLWYANPAANWPGETPPALHQYGYYPVPGGAGDCDANNFGPAYIDISGGPTPPPAEIPQEDSKMFIVLAAQPDGAPGKVLTELWTETGIMLKSVTEDAGPFLVGASGAAWSSGGRIPFVSYGNADEYLKSAGFGIRSIHDRLLQIGTTLATPPATGGGGTTPPAPALDPAKIQAEINTQLSAAWDKVRPAMSQSVLDNVLAALNPPKAAAPDPASPSN